MEIFGNYLNLLTKIIPNTGDKAGSFALLGGLGLAGIAISGAVFFIMGKKNKKK